MSDYQTSLLYETNWMSDAEADATVTREMSQLKKEGPTVCLICGEAVKMIAAEKAATVCQSSRRLIYRWIEAGDLHFIEALDGEVLVCGRSLSQKMDELDSSTGRL